MSEPLPDPPITWKTKLRSLKPGVNHADQVAYNFNNGLVGIGWGVPKLRTRSSLERVLRGIRDQGWGDTACWTVRRFAQQAKIGDFIWTRDVEGRFRVGQITGDYRFDNSPQAQAVDTHQVRQAVWAPRPLGDLEVPGAVIRGFSGQSTSFDRIHDRGARLYTAWIWEEVQGRQPAPLDMTPHEVLKQLEPYDLEDLIYTWMQVERDYLALPKARRTDTPAYEWTMLNRKSHRPAIVQVKSGAQAVDLEALAAAAPDDKTTLFAYSAAEKYTGSTPRKVKRIKTDELLTFVANNRALLPPRVRTWFDLAKGTDARAV